MYRSLHARQRSDKEATRPAYRGLTVQVTPSKWGCGCGCGRRQTPKKHRDVRFAATCGLVAKHYDQCCLLAGVHCLVASAALLLYLQDCAQHMSLCMTHVCMVLGSLTSSSITSASDTQQRATLPRQPWPRPGCPQEPQACELIALDRYRQAIHLRKSLGGLYKLWWTFPVGCPSSAVGRTCRGAVPGSRKC